MKKNIVSAWDLNTVRCTRNGWRHNQQHDALPLHHWVASVLRLPIPLFILIEVCGRLVRVFLAYKNSRPNWDANSWQKEPRKDAISLSHLPRRSSKNSDRQSANVARQTDRLRVTFLSSLWKKFSRTFDNTAIIYKKNQLPFGTSCILMEFALQTWAKPYNSCLGVVSPASNLANLYSKFFT